VTFWNLWEKEIDGIKNGDGFKSHPQAPCPFHKACSTDNPSAQSAAMTTAWAPCGHVNFVLCAVRVMVVKAVDREFEFETLLGPNN
jgi:hypothetical protein